MAGDIISVDEEEEGGAGMPGCQERGNVKERNDVMLLIRSQNASVV